MALRKEAKSRATDGFSARRTFTSHQSILSKVPATVAVLLDRPRASMGAQSHRGSPRATRNRGFLLCCHWAATSCRTRLRLYSGYCTRNRIQLPNMKRATTVCSFGRVSVKPTCACTYPVLSVKPAEFGTQRSEIKILSPRHTFPHDPFF